MSNEVDQLQWTGGRSEIFNNQCLHCMKERVCENCHSGSEINVSGTFIDQRISLSLFLYHITSKNKALIHTWYMYTRYLQIHILHVPPDRVYIVYIYTVDECCVWFTMEHVSALRVIHQRTFVLIYKLLYVYTLTCAKRNI